jgi:hypothetical protein
MIMMLDMIKRRYVTLLAVLFVFVSGNAQTLRGDFDLTDYPEISFVWNEYNPEIKDSTQFFLTADSGNMPVRVRQIPQNDSVLKPKTVLFLWEDLNHRSHAEQSLFTQIVLSNILNEATGNEQDKFNVAVFDRKGGNDSGTTIHSWLSDSFTSDRRQLAEAVRKFNPKYDQFSNQKNSELYMAIEEGINRLEKEPSDRTRAIVVFTAGSNLDNYGGRNSIDEARALSLKIPVYVVKYPVRGCEHCSNIDLICQNTYGRQISTDNTSAAISLLREYLLKMSERHYGQDYRISFTAAYPRDAQQHSITLNVSGKEYPLFFTAPPFSLKVWIKENLLWTVIAGAGLLIFIVLLIILTVCKASRRRREIRSLETQQQAAQQAADANRRELENYRRQREEEESAVKKQEQEQHFVRLMQTKNLFPRLQYSIDGKNANYTIRKPETTIGRDGNNDLIITHDSVSRHHARITFNGSCFEIQDLGSTNRVIVNGAFVEQSILAKGDIIGLGEITVYYNV